ncbi:hypothetical protein LSTR_LSTR004697 [Laodelphax striatellus]|uniref:Uncharacterized protein n=1 Tax=Laodelphax striatellus TaxID=195883 RepID=A0A482WTT0_LAOST|nr:hypothetical protein LSTR_LSTR004697 [Laodelphax striatellus]
MRESSSLSESEGSWVNSVMGVLRWRERNNNRHSSQSDKTVVNLSSSPTLLTQPITRGLYPVNAFPVYAALRLPFILRIALSLFAKCPAAAGASAAVCLPVNQASVWSECSAVIVHPNLAAAKLFGKLYYTESTKVRIELLPSAPARYGFSTCIHLKFEFEFKPRTQLNRIGLLEWLWVGPDWRNAGVPSFLKASLESSSSHTSCHCCYRNCGKYLVSNNEDWMVCSYALFWQGTL